MLLQEDDEHTLEEDEALITEEERKEELAALQNEVDLPLEELLKRYAVEKGESCSVHVLMKTRYCHHDFMLTKGGNFRCDKSS